MEFKKLKAVMDSLPAYGIPGCDAIAMKDHKVIFRYSAGFADTDTGRKLSGNELFYMYSCTKPVTVTAALQLYERGKFLMSDPVAAYLPEFATVRVRNGAYTFETETPVTMKHLFTMTAGMSYNLTSAYIQEVRERTNGRCPTRETVAAMAKMPLDFQPGTHFQYSLCHDVLAAVVEVISGERFSEYVRKNILLPCGMNESGFRETEEVRSRLAPQYRYNDKTKRAEKTPLSNMYILGSEYDSGGAGLISSVADYIKFEDALACDGVSALGERILSPRTVKMMRRNCLCGEALSEFRRRFPGLSDYGYGFGVRTMDGSDPTGGSLSPSCEFGWNGAAGSYAMIAPDEHVSLFYAQHMLNNKEAYVHPRLRNSFFADLDQ